MPHLKRRSKTLRDYCDPKIVSVVDEAYEVVWAIIQNKDLSAGAQTECDRKAELSQTIGTLVVEGVTDPTELRDRALTVLGYPGVPDTD